MSGRFGAVLTAMVTPFAADGSVDLDKAAALARRLVDQGNDGLVVTGTTGEAPTLTDDEKIALWEAVSAAVTVPVIAGSGTYDTAHSVKLSKEAARVGASGILAVTPYYNRPSQAGLEAHVRAVAASTDLPVMLYDIPFRTGRKLTTETILRLAREVPTVVAVKDAAGDVAETAALMTEAPAGFELYSGEDKLTLALLAVGAVGTVSVASHWTTAAQVEMLTAFWKGDVERARQLNARLVPSWAYESSDDAPNPVPSKALLNVLGLAVGECRLPMGPEPDDLRDRARKVLADLGDLAAAPVEGGLG